MKHTCIICQKEYLSGKGRSRHERNIHGVKFIRGRPRKYPKDFTNSQKVAALRAKRAKDKIPHPIKAPRIPLKNGRPRIYNY